MAKRLRPTSIWDGINDDLDLVPHWVPPNMHCGPLPWGGVSGGSGAPAGLPCPPPPLLAALAPCSPGRVTGTCKASCLLSICCLLWAKGQVIHDLNISPHTPVSPRAPALFFQGPPGMGGLLGEEVGAGLQPEGGPENPPC